MVVFMCEDEKELRTEVGEVERMEGVGELKVGVDRSK